MSKGIKMGKPTEKIFTRSPSTPAEVVVNEETADSISLAEILENLSSWFIFVQKYGELRGRLGVGKEF